LLLEARFLVQKFTKYRLVAGLCLVLLGELQRSHRSLATVKGPTEGNGAGVQHDFLLYTPVKHYCQKVKCTEENKG